MGWRRENLSSERSERKKAVAVRGTVRAAVEADRDGEK